MILVNSEITRSGPDRQTISSSTPTVVSGLSINFTPSYDDSLIMIKAVLISSATYVCNWSIYKDGSPTVSTSGFTNNSYPDANVTTYINDSTTNWLWPIPIIWSEVSGSTNSRVYDVRAQSRWSGTNRNLYINNRSNNDMASFSYLKIMEFKDIS